MRAITPDLGGDRAARAEFQKRLNAVIATAASELHRPGLVCTEQYYSLSNSPGSLGRHMDEKHEELKGARTAEWLAKAEKVYALAELVMDRAMRAEVGAEIPKGVARPWAAKL